MTTLKRIDHHTQLVQDTLRRFDFDAIPQSLRNMIMTCAASDDPLSSPASVLLITEIHQHYKCDRKDAKVIAEAILLQFKKMNQRLDQQQETIQRVQSYH